MRDNTTVHDKGHRPQCPMCFLLNVPGAPEVTKTTVLAFIDTDDPSHQNRSPPWEQDLSVIPAA